MAALRPARTALAILLLGPTLGAPAAAATITLQPGAGFADPTPATPEGGNSGITLGQQRTIVFQAAAAAWGLALTSNQEIKIAAQFSALSCGPSSGTLGSAGATAYLALDDGSQSRFFPIALAESLLGSNENDADAEIVANFNATIDASDPGCLGNTRWYYGLVGPAPAGTFALYPTVLHEIGHGLGFAAFLCEAPAGCTGPSTPYGGYFFGVPDIWSDFLRDNNVDGVGGNKRWSAMSNAERVASFTHDPLLVWDGPNVTNRLAAFGQDGAELNESRLRMYAPATFDAGSSVSHFHEASSPNLLMEPNADADVFRQTDLTDCLFADIGWAVPRCYDTAPTLNAIANPAAINEDAGTQSVNLGGIGSGGGAQSVSVTAVSGDLALIPNPTVSYTSPSSSGSLSYAPVANRSGSALVLVTATDSVGSSQARTFTVTVNPVNDAPSATNLSAAQSYTEDTPLDLADIVISDVDHASLGVTLTLSNPAAGTLNTAASGGVTSTFNSGTGTWQANGAIASVNTLLAGLTFTPAANFNATFSIATSVSDGVAAPLAGSKTMSGIGVNDAPGATNLSAAEVYTEDQTRDLTNIVITDVDSANVSATLTLSNPAAGSLTTATAGSVTSNYNAGTGVWSASGPLANVNALLAGVAFVPAANFNGNFGIATAVGDGLAPPLAGSKAMTGTAVDDAPTASNLSAAETYVEDVALDLANIVVADIDSAVVQATLTLSAPSFGSLSTATAGSTTSTYVAATGVWSAAGPMPEVNALLAGVSFVPAANVNAGFSIATRVTDGASPAPTGSKAMSGIPFNDAPQASNLSTAEHYAVDTPLNLVNIVVSDVDGDDLAVTLTLSDPAAGSLSTATSGTVSSTFVAATGVWMANGAPASVNALLAGLVFTPAAGFDAAFSIQTRVSDGVAAALVGNKAMSLGPVSAQVFQDGFEEPG